MFGRTMLALCLLGVAALLFPGCSDHTTPLTPPGNAVMLTVVDNETGQPTAPLWVAFQDGVSGSWTRLSPADVPGLFTAEVTDAARAYGFAVAVDDGYGVSMYYLQATLSDGRALTLPVSTYSPEAFTRTPPGQMPRPRRVTRESNDWTWGGTADGLPSSFDYESHADAFGDGSFSPVSGAFPFDFRFPAGAPSDAIIILNHADQADGNDLLFLRRDMTHTAGTSIDDGIDFSAPWNGSKHTWELTQEGTVSAPGAYSMGASFRTANGTVIPLNSIYDSSCNYPLLPAAAIEDGDRYLYSADANTRSVQIFSDDPLTSLTLPTAFSCDYAGLTFSGLNAEDVNLYQFYLGTNSRFWLGYVSPAWLAAADATSMTFPDLSGVDGWDASWGYSENNPPLYVSATKVEYNTSLASFLAYWLPGYLQAPPADGDYVRWSAEYFGND